MNSLAYANPDVLVSTEWVAEHASDPSVRVIESNEDVLLYDTGHVTGADPAGDSRVNWSELLERGDQGLSPQAGPIGRDAISFVM